MFHVADKEAIVSLTNHPTPSTELPSNTIYCGSKKAFQVMTSLHVEVKLLHDTASVMTLTLRRLMSYIYGAPILDVSRSHTTTQHSR